jgi:hypothetical protein
MFRSECGRNHKTNALIAASGITSFKDFKDAKLIKLDKLGTMNFYHVDTDRTIIKKMQTLFNHMDMLITDFEEDNQ